MNGKIMQKQNISVRHLTDLLCSLTVLMVPVTLTAVLSTGSLLAGNAGDGWAVCCFLMTALVWAGAVVCTKTRFLGKPMPKTGLVLSAALTLSVLFYTLAFAMEMEVIGFRTALWALGRLIGAPAAVSVRGAGILFGGVMEGTAAMLTCAVYLVIALAAAIPVRGKRRQETSK